MCDNAYLIPDVRPILYNISISDLPVCTYSVSSLQALVDSLTKLFIWIAEYHIEGWRDGENPVDPVPPPVFTTIPIHIVPPHSLHHSSSNQLTTTLTLIYIYLSKHPPPTGYQYHDISERDRGWGPASKGCLLTYCRWETRVTSVHLWIHFKTN